MLICRQQLRRKNVLSQVGKETLQLAGEDYIEVNFLNTHCVYLLDLVAASVVAIVKGVAYRAAPSVVPSVHVYTIYPNGWFAKWDITQKRVYYLYIIYIAFGCNIWYTIPNKTKVVKVCP